MDKAMAESFSDISRNRIQHLIRSGHARLSGRDCVSKDKVAEGDVMELFVPPVEISQITPEDRPVDVLFEDDHIIVVNKPPFVPVHPGVGNPDGTLVNAVLAHCKTLCNVGGYMRPGVVHRLDKDTSGILVMSKTDIAHRGLVMQFRSHSIDRRYMALVYGIMPQLEGTIETLIARHPADRKRFTSKALFHGKQAITHWTMIESYGGLISLLELKLETGRTHQIRVHMADMQHPVVGDPVYGQTSRRLKNLADAYMKGIVAPLKRQALHAKSLGFKHPVSGKHLSFKAVPPADMADVLQKLRKKYSYD